MHFVIFWWVSKAVTVLSKHYLRLLKTFYDIRFVYFKTKQVSNGQMIKRDSFGFQDTTHTYNLNVCVKCCQIFSFFNQTYHKKNDVCFNDP